MSTKRVRSHSHSHRRWSLGRFSPPHLKVNPIIPSCTCKDVDQYHREHHHTLQSSILPQTSCVSQKTLLCSVNYFQIAIVILHMVLRVRDNLRTTKSKQPSMGRLWKCSLNYLFEPFRWSLLVASQVMQSLSRLFPGTIVAKALIATIIYKDIYIYIYIHIYIYMFMYVYIQRI